MQGWQSQLLLFQSELIDQVFDELLAILLLARVESPLDRVLQTGKTHDLRDSLRAFALLTIDIDVKLVHERIQRHVLLVAVNLSSVSLLEVIVPHFADRDQTLQASIHVAVVAFVSQTHDTLG